MTIEEALKEIRDEASYDSYSHPSQWALDKLDRIWELANEALETAVARVDQLEKGLAILYRSHPVDVARVCDEVIDQRGALLGRVRDLAGAGQVPADTIEKARFALHAWSVSDVVSQPGYERIRDLTVEALAVLAAVRTPEEQTERRHYEGE